MAAPIPRGLHHLESTFSNKFSHRYSPRVLSKKAYVPPADRIKHWNIRPGDKVRLIVGKDKDKYEFAEPAEGEEVGERLGSKIHEVTGVDRERNRVLLKSVTYKKSNPIAKKPANYASLSVDEKAQYDAQQNFLVVSRPVDYSNVQLVVKERGWEEGGSIFAARLKTSEPKFDRHARFWRYERYAAKVVGEGQGKKALDILEDANVARTNDGYVMIDWPKIEKGKTGEASKVDTRYVRAGNTTVSLSFPDEIWASPSTVPLPNSSRANPLDLPRQVADDFITGTEDFGSSLLAARSLLQEGEDPDIALSNLQGVDGRVDTLMPLYLSEELSPRFSRAKATRGWTLRREAETRERKMFVEEKVEEWRAGGKDSGLEDAMAAVGLDGVKLRRRTLAEVEESAAREYDGALGERSRIMRLARAKGGRWDLDEGRWRVEMEEGERKRKEKKARRKVAREEKLKVMDL